MTGSTRQGVSSAPRPQTPGEALSAYRSTSAAEGRLPSLRRVWVREGTCGDVVDERTAARAVSVVVRPPHRVWEVSLAVLSIVVFVCAAASIVIMLGLLPAEDVERLRTLVE